MDQSRRPPCLVHQIGGGPGADRGGVRCSDVGRCSQTVLDAARHAVLLTQSRVVLETAGGQQHPTPGSNPDRGAAAVRYCTDHTSVVIAHQVHQFGVAMQGGVRKALQSKQETTDDCPTAGQQIRCWLAEELVVQRAADQCRVGAEPFAGQWRGDDVAHAVAARLRCVAEVIRPRQHGEFEGARIIRVGLEVVDQRRAAAHVGLLKVARGALAHHGVEVGQRRVDGVIAPGAAQHGVARKPHAAAPGIGGGAAELLAGLQ